MEVKHISSCPRSAYVGTRIRCTCGAEAIEAKAPIREFRLSHVSVNADGSLGIHGVATREEPAPILTAETPVWELVIADMQARDHAGRERYGMPLQASNGRDHLVDAYQEALDLCCYLRAEIARRESR